MSIMYITGYAQLAQLAGDAGQMPDEGTLTEEQFISFTAAHGASAVLNPGTKYVRINVDGIANIKFSYGTVGVPPTAAAVAGQSQRFAAGQTEFKGVTTNGNGSGNNKIQ